MFTRKCYSFIFLGLMFINIFAINIESIYEPSQKNYEQIQYIPENNSFKHNDDFISNSLDNTTANSYYLDVELNTVAATVSGDLTINFTNWEDVGLTHIVFHLHPKDFTYYNGDLEIHDIQILGGNIGIDHWVVVYDTILDIVLNGTLPVLESVDIEIDFTTSIPNIQNRFGYMLNPYEAYYLTNWYPVLSVYDENGWDLSPFSHYGESYYYDMAFYQIEITVPNGFKVACSLPFNNIIYSSKTTYNTSKIWIRDLAFCASPDFTTSTTNWNDVEITSYYFDNATFTTRGNLADELGRSALQVYTDSFGDYLWSILVN